MPDLTVSTTLEEYAKAAGSVLIRNLRSQFLVYALSFLPASLAGPLGPLANYVFGWIFDWVEKQAAFQVFCKYSDFRVAHQGTDLGHAIYLEIIAKKTGDKNAILEAEKNADKHFDDFVIISH